MITMLFLDCLAFGVRHEGHESGQLDGVANLALMFLAEAGAG